MEKREKLRKSSPSVSSKSSSSKRGQVVAKKTISCKSPENPAPTEIQDFPQIHDFLEVHEVPTKEDILDVEKASEPAP